MIDLGLIIVLTRITLLVAINASCLYLIVTYMNKRKSKEIVDLEERLSLLTRNHESLVAKVFENVDHLNDIETRLKFINKAAASLRDKNKEKNKKDKE